MQLFTLAKLLMLRNFIGVLFIKRCCKNSFLYIHFLVLTLKIFFFTSQIQVNKEQNTIFNLLNLVTSFKAIYWWTEKLFLIIICCSQQSSLFFVITSFAGTFFYNKCFIIFSFNVHCAQKDKRCCFLYKISMLLLLLYL